MVEFATTEVMIAKMAGTNKLIGMRLPHGGFKLTDVEGSFETRFEGTGDEWQSFHFLHDGVAYRADANVTHTDEDVWDCCVYLLCMQHGKEETDTSEYWTVY